MVDHFLLLQGLATAGLTQDDIDFRGVLTADAASSFAGGQFDCVGVFAPFTVEALKRPGSHVVFSSKDFPGSIPDHIVVSQSMVAKQPKVAQKIVNAWYDTLDYIAANPDKATKIMADAAQVSTADYDDFAKGTKIFSVDEALAAFTPSDAPTSLAAHGRPDQPLPREVGADQEAGVAEEPLRPAVHPGLRHRPPGGGDHHHRTLVVTSVGAPPARRTRVGRARGRGRRQHALLRLRGDIPIGGRIALAVFGIVVLLGFWWLAADLLVKKEFLPNPTDTLDGLKTYWNSGDFGSDVWASSLRILKGYSISLVIGAVLGLFIGSFRSVEAFWESPIGFLRYIPATALVPLFLAWLGIDEAPKVALVIAGTVFFNIVMMADVARLVPREMILAAYTLGAGRGRVMRRVVLPHCLPGMIDVARVNLAAAWPMLVVAELLAATDGLGYRLTVFRRGNEWDQIFAILVVFAVIGITSDLFLRWLRNRVSPWARS